LVASSLTASVLLDSGSPAHNTVGDRASGWQGAVANWMGGVVVVRLHARQVAAWAGGRLLGGVRWGHGRLLCCIVKLVGRGARPLGLGFVGAFEAAPSYDVVWQRWPVSFVACVVKGWRGVVRRQPTVATCRGSAL
jgi:hypothetical protein